jgi:hypothetical protein
MIFNNPNFISFAGEPITGRTPTKTIVLGDWPMTQAQQGGVAHAYKLFCDTVRLSPAEYHVQNRILSDGTTVRMISNNGIDTVEVRPVGGGGSVVECIFRGVPSSASHPSGDAALGPSGRWDRYLTTPMPASLKKVGPLVDHPGHVTWTGKNFKVRRQEVILSWRGPGDRYSSSTGWDAVAGGNIVGHATTIGDTAVVYKDSSFVWFDGLAVDTGIEKVIAAALHRPDPANLNEVVLRVCSDSFPQGTGTRGLVTYDLVPTDATAPVPLDAIISATGFDILETYQATQFSTSPSLPVVGTWVTHQRPHFNNSGDKLAVSMQWNEAGTPRFVAACLNPTSWEILEHYSQDGETVEAQTASTSYTYVPTSSPPVIETATTNRSYTLTRTQYTTLLAADFLDDAFVHMTMVQDYSSELTEASNGTSSTGTGTAAFDTHTVMQAVHSIHGVMSTRTHDTAYLSETSVSGGTGTLSVSGPSSTITWSSALMCGDLSRDIVAVGWPVAGQQNRTYSGSATVEAGNLVAVGAPVSFTRETSEFDVFVDGMQIAAGTVGSFAAVANPTVSSTLNLAETIPPAVLLAGGASPEFTYSTTTTVPFSTATYWGGAPLLFKHVAVSGGARAAYLGVGLPQERGGLEMTIIKRKTGGKILNVPAYAEGTTPTICAPIFLSVTEIRK